MDGPFHGKMFTYRMKVTFSAFYGWMIASILLYIVTFLVDKIMVAREKMHTNNGGGAGRFSFPGQEHIAAGPSELGVQREEFSSHKILVKNSVFQKALD